MGWFSNLFSKKEEESEDKILRRFMITLVLAAAALFSALTITHNQAIISRNKAAAAAFMQEESNEKALQHLIDRMTNEVQKTGRVQQDTLGRAKTIADALEREAAAMRVDEPHQKELQTAKLAKIDEVRELIKKIDEDNQREEPFFERPENLGLKHAVFFHK